MKSYVIASEEGAQRYGQELGAALDADLSEDEERAVVAAGWLEPGKKKEKS